MVTIAKQLAILFGLNHTPTRYNDDFWWHIIVISPILLNKLNFLQWSWKKDILFWPCFVVLHTKMNFFANANICITSLTIVMWLKCKWIIIALMLTTWCYWSSPMYIVNGLYNNLYEFNHSLCGVICWVVLMLRNHILVALLEFCSTIAMVQW